MTPSQINAAIAQLCGIPVDVCMCGEPINGSHDNHHFVPMAKQDDIPNYHADLNACHEMEKTLNQADCFSYRDSLQEMVLKTVASRSTDFTFGATATQRAEAFLRVHGKWEESK